jgi:hypothetical protein
MCVYYGCGMPIYRFDAPSAFSKNSHEQVLATDGPQN